MKYSSSVLASSQKLLIVFNAHKMNRIDKAQKILSAFKKSDLKNSFREYKQNKIIRSERLIAIYKKKGLHHFDILRKAGFVANENSFSDAIAAILDPNGSHQLGIDPIAQILNQLVNHNPNKIKAFKNLIKNNNSQIVVHRERHEGKTIPDIEIVCSDFIIFIENKVRGGSETIINDIWQTDRQWEALLYRSRTLNISEKNILAIFLTPEGKIPKNKHFIPLSVSELVSALRNTAINSTNINTKYSLLTFLNYYAWE